ncbi:MAG: SBBP repeat-containing protein [Armatimonadetes bacterium]|nr:SBBP repeat-containing protein [Armatimonadota bacterium]
MYLLAFVSGCGSGGTGGGIPLSVGTGVARSGSLELRIQWPGVLSKGKLIPATAKTIQVTVTGEGLPSPLVQSVAKSQVQNGQVTLSFSNVPTGGKTTEVKALDSSGNIVAHRIASASVQENQTATVTTQLGVTISDGSYTPAQFTLNKGETLLWVNGGAGNHSVKADNGLFDSGNLAPGGSFSWTATTPGNFPYNCTIHNAQTGTLVVQFPAPAVTGISPASGPTGTPLTINGTNFGALQSENTVTMGGKPAVATSWTDTTITCTVPQGVGVTSGDLVVTVQGVPSNALTFAVTPVAVWTREYNAPSDGLDEGRGITVDPAGNVYVAGVASYPGQTQDIWLGKYDALGNNLWVQTHDGPQSLADYGYDVAAGPLGNVFVSGYETVAGQGANVWVRQYVAGSPGWTQTYAGPAGGTDQGQGITTDVSGNVYVIGSEDPGGGNDDIWIRKYRGDGAILWTRSYDSGAGSFDSGEGIAVDVSGNVYVTGYVTVPGQNENIWVRKYDSNGNTLWTQTYNSPGNFPDLGQGIAVDSQGNVYVAGAEGRYDLGQSLNAWVRKYDADGNPLWTRTHNSPANSVDLARRVTVDSAGNVYVIGYETRQDLGQQENIWIRKYDTNGNAFWTETHDGTANGNDTGYDIFVDTLGQVFVTGYTLRGGAPPDATDIWIRKYRQ